LLGLTRNADADADADAGADGRGHNLNLNLTTCHEMTTLATTNAMSGASISAVSKTTGLRSQCNAELGVKSQAGTQRLVPFEWFPEGGECCIVTLRSSKCNNKKVWD
jgi:hypothetical protein